MAGPLWPAHPGRLRQGERSHLLRPAWGVLGEEELVELRRRDRGLGQQVVNLAAVMHLIDDQLKPHLFLGTNGSWSTPNP